MAVAAQHRRVLVHATAERGKQQVAILMVERVDHVDDEKRVIRSPTRRLRLLSGGPHHRRANRQDHLLVGGRRPAAARRINSLGRGYLRAARVAARTHLVDPGVSTELDRLDREDPADPLLDEFRVRELINPDDAHLLVAADRDYVTDRPRRNGRH
jgi:hypothetical protein